MEEKLTLTANDAIRTITTQDFRERSGIEEVFDAMKWLSRDKRFSIGGNRQDDERIWVFPLLHGAPELIEQGDKKTTPLCRLCYHVTSISGGKAELDHVITVSHDPKANFEECFIISHSVETKKAAQVGKAGYRKETCLPIPFGWNDMERMGEAVEAIVVEYVLRPEDVPLFEGKLYSTLPDPKIYMCETSGMTHDELAVRIDG